MAQHTILTIRVLDAYALEIVRGFQCEEGDKLVSRTTAKGCTTIIYEISQGSLRSDQRAYLEEVKEVMIDRLELLRHSKSVKGRTLFAWETYNVTAPRHDIAMLNRQPWKEAILAAAR